MYKHSNITDVGVWSCSSYGTTSDGYLHPSGYRHVRICGQNYAVHRVVMLAFKGLPSNEQAWQVHHKDGDKANNRLDNLEYGTRSQNMLYSMTCTPLTKRVVQVHRLIAFAFLGPPPCVRSTQVNHKDVDKGNNSAHNLEWVSPAGNMSHFHENNMFQHRNGKTVLSRVHGSTGEWKWHCSALSPSRATGVDRRSIWQCCNRRLPQTMGHEFKHADTDIDGAKSLPGEEWREVDIKVLRDDRIARKR